MLYLVNVINFVRTVAGIGINDEEGQGLVEYVLIIALIAIVVVGGFAAVSGGILGAFQGIADELPAAPGA